MNFFTSLLDFGFYSAYIWSTVGVSLTFLSFLLWVSLRQLSKEKKALEKSKKTFVKRYSASYKNPININYEQ